MYERMDYSWAYCTTKCSLHVLVDIGLLIYCRHQHVDWKLQDKNIEHGQYRQREGGQEWDSSPLLKEEERLVTIIKRRRKEASEEVWYAVSFRTLVWSSIRSFLFFSFFAEMNELMRTLELAESLLDLLVTLAALEVYFQCYFEDLHESMEINYIRSYT